MASVTLGTTPSLSGDQESLPTVTATPVRSDHLNNTRLRQAAFHATRIYPGPVGELVAAELLAVEEFGYRLSGSSRAHRLAEHILAQIPEQP